MGICIFISICIPLCTAAAQMQRHSLLSGLLGAEAFFSAFIYYFLGNQPIEAFVI